MVPLPSELENREEDFGKIQATLVRHQFSLGGNWEYDHGSFDRFLDEGHKVWLRLPFKVTRGHLDGETVNEDTFIRMGTPFVLKHIYNEGLDGEAQVRTLGGMVDQFQEPVDNDADIEQKWVDQANLVLKDVEMGLRYVE
jgi:hypothetical protein